MDHLIVGSRLQCIHVESEFLVLRTDSERDTWQASEVRSTRRPRYNNLEASQCEGELVE